MFNQHNDCRYQEVFTGGTSDITYQMADERGWGIFVPPLLPLSVLEGPLDVYNEACAKAGNQSAILYLRPVYLGDDGELTILTNSGGMEHWKTVKTQELFAEHVMSEFRMTTD